MINEDHPILSCPAEEILRNALKEDDVSFDI